MPDRLTAAVDAVALRVCGLLGHRWPQPGLPWGAVCLRCRLQAGHAWRLW